MKTAPALLSIAIVAAMLVACRGDGGGGRSDEPIIIHFGLAAADLNRDGLTDFVSGSATLDGGPPPHPGRLRVYLQRSSAPGRS